MTTHTSWQPLVTGELAERLRASLDEILVAVKADRLIDEDPLSALLYEYADRADRSDKHADTVNEIVDRAIASIAEGVHSPALYGGFTGLAWLTSHIIQVEAGDEDPNEEIDASLHALLARSPWLSFHDLIAGIVGIGVYFLERLVVQGGSSIASVCLELVVDRLAELATYSSAGATWFTPAMYLPEWQRELAPGGYYNLGVAHGIPGVIAFLGQVCEANVGGSRARELLGQSVDWLLAQPPTKGARFPDWIVDDGLRNRGDAPRLAWCYGDLGVAAALLRAARCVGEPRWESEALDIGRTEAARRDDGSRVREPGLCHGTAGFAHIFNRLFQATGDAIFADAARYWFQDLLDTRVPGAGIAGYLPFRRDGGELQPRELRSNFLEGGAGVGLSILAATSDVEPSWDRLLLVSVPPRVVPGS